MVFKISTVDHQEFEPESSLRENIVNKENSLPKNFSTSAQVFFCWDVALLGQHLEET